MGVATIPFLRPNLVKVESYLDHLRAIDASHCYSNFGPLNTAFEARIAGPLLQVLTIEFVEQGEAIALTLLRNLFRGGRREEIGNGGRSTRVDKRALVRHGEERGREVAFLIVGQALRVREDDEGGEIVGESAQRI